MGGRLLSVLTSLRLRNLHEMRHVLTINQNDGSKPKQEAAE